MRGEAFHGSEWNVSSLLSLNSKQFFLSNFRKLILNICDTMSFSYRLFYSCHLLYIFIFQLSPLKSHSVVESIPLLRGCMIFDHCIDHSIYLQLNFTCSLKKQLWYERQFVTVDLRAVCRLLTTKCCHFSKMGRIF